MDLAGDLAAYVTLTSRGRVGLCQTQLGPGTAQQEHETIPYGDPFMGM